MTRDGADDAPIGDVPLASYPERSYDEIIAAGRPAEPVVVDDDDIHVAWGALFVVVLIFGGLGLLAVLMSRAASDEPLPVTGGGGHAVVSAAPAVAFGPGEAPPAFHERGTGTRVFEAHRPDAGLLVLYVKVDRGRLTLSEVDEHDIRKSNLQVVDGPYEGQIVLWGGGTVERLRVEATGTWVVELRSVRSMPVRQAPFTGTEGDHVFWYDGPAAIGTLTYAGSSGSLGVDSFDEHRGGPDRIGRVRDGSGPERVRWPRGPVLIEVDANGPWGIVLTPL